MSRDRVDHSEYRQIDDALRPALINKTFYNRVCRLLKHSCDDVVRKCRLDPRNLQDDPLRVFSKVTPNSTVVEERCRDKHWRPDGSCVSLRHFDIINPEFMDEFIETTGIRPRSSLMNDSLRICEPLTTNLKAVNLRKVQNSEWALESVATGVAYAKDNEMDKAMKAYHHALEIDSECVDAHVAVGAAYANVGKLENAVKSFQQALNIDPTHLNARQYLNSTLLKLGRPVSELRMSTTASTVLLDQMKTPNPMQSNISHTSASRSPKRSRSREIRRYENERHGRNDIYHNHKQYNDRGERGRSREDVRSRYHYNNRPNGPKGYYNNDRSYNQHPSGEYYDQDYYRRK